MKHIIKRLKNKHRKSKTLGIKTEKRKAVGGDCKESNIEEKVRGNTAEDGISL